MSDRDGRTQPGKPESDERLLARRYMLGGLSSQQQDDVERRFLFDPAFEDIVLEEETDLFDALAAGTLSSDDERALRLYASARRRTQTRLEAAFAFSRLRSDTAQDSAFPVSAALNRIDELRAHRFFGLWVAGAAVACLALMTATLWLPRRHSVAPIGNSAGVSPRVPISATPLPPSTGEAATVPLPAAPETAAAAHPESVATLFLMAEETRSLSSPQRLHLKPGTSAITLQLASQTGLSNGEHIVQLTGADGYAVRLTRVRTRRLHGQNFVEATLDANRLRPGEYTVLLREKDEAVSSPALTYHFQIVAP